MRHANATTDRTFGAAGRNRNHGGADAVSLVAGWVPDVVCAIVLVLALQTAARAEQCLSVTDEPPVPSTELSEAMKGKCPIQKCFGQSCSCYDRLYTTEVVNNCPNPVTIDVNAGGNYSSGQHKLSKNQQAKYSCEEARDGCSGVKISEIGEETETPNQFKPNPPKNQAASPADLDEARKKAADALAKAQKAAKEQAETRSKQADDKNRLKQDALKLPAFCEGVIEACEQRNAKLTGLSEATRSQCNAYCAKLRSENCAPTSAVQQASEACRTSSEHDQIEAAERLKQAQQAEAEREARENYIPPGWSQCSCPPDHMHLIAEGRAKMVHGILYHPGNVGPCQ